MKSTIFTVALWLAIAFAAFSAYEFVTAKPVQNVPYSTFVYLIDKNKVEVLRIAGDQRTVTFSVKDKSDVFRTVSPTDLGKITDEAIGNGVTVLSEPLPQPVGIWISILIGIVPVLVLVFFMYRLATKRNSADGILGFGKNKAKLVDPTKNKTRLSDVISNPGEHDEAKEIIDFLSNPEDYSLAKAKFPKGILLQGPPGVGKTLVAKAIAGEAGVPFFAISGSDFVEMFVGVGASRVRSMFEEAKANAPCIIFIDEIDAVGRSRTGNSHGGGNREADQTLNQLLVEMDGFNDDTKIIILAATNRADVLDPALLRPGRFDRIISVGLPDVSAREKILDLHLKTVNRGGNIDTALLAKGTSGFSGAELANIVNEAALKISREKRMVITMADMEAAKDKVMMGAESPKKMNNDELKLTAYHEAGHAIVGSISPGHDPVYKVSIVPRRNALGVTVFVPDEDQYSISLKQIHGTISTLLGGRAAEELVFGLEMVTTGASSDLERATAWAKKMVTKWGMSSSLGLSQYVKNTYLADTDYSEETARKIDQEVEGILQQNYETAKQILTEHKKELDIMAEALLKYETISQEVVKQIMNGTYVDEN